LQRINEEKRPDYTQTVKKLDTTCAVKAPREEMIDLMKAVVQITRDEDVRSGRSFSALHAAFSIGNQKVLEALLLAGISASLTDRFGRSFLDVSLDPVVRQRLVEYSIFEKCTPPDVFESKAELSCVMWGCKDPCRFLKTGSCDACGKALKEDFFYREPPTQICKYIGKLN